MLARRPAVPSLSIAGIGRSTSTSTVGLVGVAVEREAGLGLERERRVGALRHLVGARRGRSEAILDVATPCRRRRCRRRRSRRRCRGGTTRRRTRPARRAARCRSTPRCRSDRARRRAYRRDTAPRRPRTGGRRPSACGSRHSSVTTPRSLSTWSGSNVACDSHWSRMFIPASSESSSLGTSSSYTVSSNVV